MKHEKYYDQKLKYGEMVKPAVKHEKYEKNINRLKINREILLLCFDEALDLKKALIYIERRLVFELISK